MDHDQVTGCAQFGDEVSRYLWGALPEERRAAVEAHLRECAPCRELATFTKDLIAVVREDSSRVLPIAEPCPDASLIVGLEAEELDEITARHVTAHLLHCKKCRDAYLLLRTLSAGKVEERALKDADVAEVSRRQAENASLAEQERLYVNLVERIRATKVPTRGFGVLNMPFDVRTSDKEMRDLVIIGSEMFYVEVSRTAFGLRISTARKHGEKRQVQLALSHWDTDELLLVWSTDENGYSDICISHALLTDAPGYTLVIEPGRVRGTLEKELAVTDNQALKTKKT